MQIRRPGDRIDRRSVVTIGNFDGVHRGHVSLLQRVRRQAQARDADSALVIFDPHPLHFLRPVSAPKLLTSMAQRLELLDETGLVDHCIIVPFDEARSRQSPRDFFFEVLVGTANANAVIVGEDFRFGERRSGTVATLTELGATCDVAVEPVPLVPVGHARPGTACSSTHVRSAVAAGDVETASRLLGRPLQVLGEVVATSWPAPGRGTPNVVLRVPGNRSVPAEGAFAGHLTAIDGRPRTAGISVREKPPVKSDILLDVHLVDRVHELMDQSVAVTFERRVWAAGSADLFRRTGERRAEQDTAGAAGGWAAW